MTRDDAIANALKCARCGIVRQSVYVVYNPGHPSTNHHNRYEARYAEHVFEHTRNLIARADPDGTLTILEA